MAQYTFPLKVEQAIVEKAELIFYGLDECKPMGKIERISKRERNLCKRYPK
jgi:aryl carrier-like protein